MAHIAEKQQELISDRLKKFDDVQKQIEACDRQLLNVSKDQEPVLSQARASLIGARSMISRQLARLQDQAEVLAGVFL